MTQNEHNIAHRKLEAAKHRIRAAQLALGSYTGDMHASAAIHLANTASARALDAAEYIARTR